jgi:gluconolactonase
MTTMRTLGWMFVASAFSAVGCHSADMQTKTPGPAANAAPAPAATATPATSPPPAEVPLAAPARPRVGLVEKLDPALDELIAIDARPEVLSEGYKWSEGPVWTAGALLFSDVPNNVVWRWSETDGVREFLRPSGYTGTVPRGGEPGSNGLAVDTAGRLYLCQHGDRRIARLAPDGHSFETIADKYDGKRFNSPNDLVVRDSGDVYFTDPIYGLPGHEKDPAREMPWSGVYRVHTDGRVDLVDKSLTFPNGLAFSRDGKKLYVAVSDPARAIWMVYEVDAKGGVSHGRVFFDATSFVKAGKKGLPDGMKIDVVGNIFATGPGGVFVFSPAGKHLGTIITGEPTANCAFGDGGQTLYMTANNKLMRIPLKTRGTVRK